MDPRDTAPRPGISPGIGRRTLLGGLLAGAATTAGLALMPGTAQAATGRVYRSGVTLRLGLASPGLPYGGDAYLQTGATLGYSPVSATSYVAWSGGGDFPASQAAAIAASGATPVFTWEPWDPTAGVTQPLYRHSAITSGLHDKIGRAHV